jgi:serine/threonine protein kinase
MDRKALYAKIKAANYDREQLKTLGISDSAQDLIAKILEPDPVKRLSPAEALKHPWITGEGQPQIVRRARLGSAIANFAEVAAAREAHEAEEAKKQGGSGGGHSNNDSANSTVDSSAPIEYEGRRKKSAIQLRDFLFFRK